MNSPTTNYQRSTINGQKGASCQRQAGALFGLDARLAMGVFATLAVIAGYVAFGRISLAQTTKLYAELQNFHDALDAYQTDMGTFFLFTLNKDVTDPSQTSEADLTALWDASAIAGGFRPHYNGPYLHVASLKHRTFGSWGVLYARGDRQDVCNLDSDCYVWLSLSNVPAEVWQKMNSIVDEAGGKAKEAAGTDVSRGRVQADGSGPTRMLFYRTVKRQDGI